MRETPGPPSADDIVSLRAVPPPPGRSPFVDGVETAGEILVVPSDPAWPHRFQAVRATLVGVLGDTALAIEHVGSTAVPGLAAKPIIDIDLTVADTADEGAYVPALQSAGFALRIREPWWMGHRGLVLEEPAVNLHIWPVGAAEPVRHILFRDRLRRDAADRALYEAAKTRAVDGGRQTMTSYNRRKEEVIRAIYQRAFRDAGLLA